MGRRRSFFRRVVWCKIELISCESPDSKEQNDVIEIDAASNNGVDEIREIRDKVKYLPGVSTYKVYIIDEVHMLSQAAFNAFLKTKYNNCIEE